MFLEAGWSCTVSLRRDIYSERPAWRWPLPEGAFGAVESSYSEHYRVAEPIILSQNSNDHRPVTGQANARLCTGETNQAVRVPGYELPERSLKPRQARAS